jgi:5-methylcytosine-specific restriction enzyme A
MSFDPSLNQGDVINNQELCDVFKCSSQGGMRRALATDTLVLISNHVDSIYDDRWLGEEFHYTGMGMEGDQNIESSQNKTLAMSPTNGVDVHLFEVFKDKQYTYSGRVELTGTPYQERQPDKNGIQRNVWVFPLKMADGAKLSIPEDLVQQVFEKKTQKAKRLSDSELKKRATSSASKAGNRNVTSKQYIRNPWVAEYAKRRANGLCQLCKNKAPFKDKFGKPFLEAHHIVWLSKMGEDSVGNTVALCPNCHRMMHTLKRKSDIELLTRQIK